MSKLSEIISLSFARESCHFDGFERRRFGVPIPNPIFDTHDPTVLDGSAERAILVLRDDLQRRQRGVSLLRRGRLDLGAQRPSTADRVPVTQTYSASIIS